MPPAFYCFQYSRFNKVFQAHSQLSPIENIRNKTNAVITPPISDGGDKINQANRTSSPIIIDLDGNGVDTLSLNDGVYFDHTGNGFMILTGWVAPCDGLLVRDINGDGEINNGGELFGDFILDVSTN